MKKYYLLCMLIAANIIVNAQQLINVNPDKKGEPWIAGGYIDISEEKINSIPEFKIPENTNKKDLPTSLDNSTQPYFRPIFNQTDGCCSQASGIAYNFTYEMNMLRGTTANTSENQFPTHYTYNFLNGGSGSNGSNYTDGWDIVIANGCPTVADYGGLAPYGDNYWMSGYSLYEDAMANKLVDYFYIDVSTPEGLETLKNWMYDHANGDAVGGIANFAAGVSDVFNMTYDNKIIEWGHSVNHAMTFVGWDDDIQYDYNNDGEYTNDEDINGDNIVDMRDWEKGALIMVNSWGTSFGNQGKAYVMYKLLAEPVENGGISGNKVYSIFARETYEPQLCMKFKMTHNSRNKVKVSAGVASNLSASEPENEIFFPLINYQGGDFNMRGSSSDPIEVTLDITPLLSYINSGEEAKFFFKLTENDPYSEGEGTIESFSVIDIVNSNEYISSQSNVNVANNDITLLSVNATAQFDAPVISTSSLPEATPANFYSQQLEATGGTMPYSWSVFINYEESTNTNNFPNISSNQLTTTSDDDGYATLPLEFDFPFYGETYNEIYISTDGSIIFTPGFDYIRTESAIMNNKIIGVFASDLMIYTDQGDGIFYEGDANSATIRWKTSLFDQPDVNVDVAAKLYPSGNIEFLYGSNITSGLSWASGVSVGDGKCFKISSLSGMSDPSDEKLTYIPSPFPLGMEITENGIFQGTPTEANQSWNIEFVVTDFDRISKRKTIAFTTGPEGISNPDIGNNEIKLYPNPVLDYANIEVSLANSSKIKIEIFDLYGKKIGTIANAYFAKGTHTIVWNKSNKLASGIYSLKTTINEQQYNNKVIVK